MNRGDAFSLCIIAVCGTVLLPGSAVSQQKSLKEQIIGAWAFVSALDVKQDGTKSDRWGHLSERSRSELSRHLLRMNSSIPTLLQQRELELKPHGSEPNRCGPQ
jgi:hypothetical protein